MARCYNCMTECADGVDICPHCGNKLSVKTDNLYYLQPGTVLCDGRYLIGNAINAGGFGIVYRAWDWTFDKMIAIKEYYPGGVAARTPGTSQVLVYSDKRVQEYEQGKERFLNEARKVAKFNTHPSIVDVYDFFEENNTAYMVMEFMEGMTYKAYIKSQGGKVKQQVAVNVALAVLDALKEVHKEKIIHRDINPSNIFICGNGMVKLFDFGAARIEKSEMSTVLTPHYAPPEQYSTTGKQGPYTDIYAVGATTYFALTGIKPEESTDRVQEDHLVPPHEVDPEIPVELSNAVMRSMALKEELRYQNTDQFRDALMNKGAVLNVEQEVKRRRRMRVIQAAAVLSALAVAGGIVFYRYRRQAEAATLQPADLKVWIMVDENDTEESAKERFAAMTENFHSSYGQVALDVTAMGVSEYEDRLNEAARSGNLPDVFDSTYLDPEYHGQLEPLDATFDLIEDTSLYLFLEQYEELFPEKKQMPLCFQIPIVYERLGTEESDPAQEVLASWEDLKKDDEYSYSVKPETFLVYDELLGKGCVETYQSLAETADKNMLQDGFSMFEEGLVSYYLSDTGDYQMLTEDMPMQFRVIFPSSKTCFVRFDHLWSVNAASDKNQKKAGQWLIYYMLSDYAQHVLGIRNLEGVPLSRSICDNFVEVYQGDLQQVEQLLPELKVGGSEWIRKNNEYMEKWK